MEQKFLELLKNTIGNKAVILIVVFLFVMKVVESVSKTKDVSSTFFRWLTKVLTAPLKMASNIAKLREENHKIYSLQLLMQEKIFEQSQNNILILEILKVPFWTSDSNGGADYISKNLCNVLDRTEQEIRGNGWATWLHPKDSGILDEYIRTIKEHRIFDRNYTFKRNDGYWIDTNGVAFHKYDANNNYIGSVGSLTKIGDPYK